jgi:protoheme ferro-lyase
VNGRARLIYGDQPGNQPAYRQAYLQMLEDQLQQIPGEKSVLVILSLHGHPFKKETMEKRAHLFRQPLEEGVRSLLASRPGKGEVLWSSDEFADAYWDKKNEKLETSEAFRKAIREGWDYALELPTEFLAENSDTMITHAMRKYYVFPDYDVNTPLDYPDWEAPLVRRFSAGKTTAIYCGTPVGPYRKYIVQAVVDSISEILQ